MSWLNSTIRNLFLFLSNPFRKRTLASVMREGTDTLCILSSEGAIKISVPDLSWFAVLYIGEPFFANDEWWMLFPYGPDGAAVAIDLECPGAELTIFYGPLSGFLDKVPQRRRIELADLPVLLRAAHRDGIALLGETEISLLLKESYCSSFQSIKDLPRVL